MTETLKTAGKAIADRIMLALTIAMFVVTVPGPTVVLVNEGPLAAGRAMLLASQNVMEGLVVHYFR